MAFTYNVIPDYVLHEMVSSVVINDLIQNYRYLGEDIFGSQTVSEFGSMSMDNGATDGGAIYWGTAGGSKYLKCDAAGTTLTLTGADVWFGARTQGMRMWLSFYLTSLTADAYSNGTANYLGLKAWKSGSIIGLSLMALQNGTNAATLQLEAHKNGASVFATAGVSVTTSVGNIQRVYASQARDTDSFAANDFLDSFVNFTAGTPNVSVGGAMEVVFDS